MSLPSRAARQSLILTLAVGSVALSGCGSDQEAKASSAKSNYPMSVTDCAGKVTIDKRPDSILTIGTAAISLLDAAGASDKISARSGEFGAKLPAGLRTPPSKAKVVDPSDPGAETIIGAGADVVYGYGLFNAKPEALKQAGIPLLTVAGECGHDAGSGTSDAISFSTVSDDIRRLGRVFGTSNVASKTADDLDSQVEALTKKAPDKEHDAAWLYYFSSSDPLSAYGSTSMADAVMDAARLKNAFAGQKTSYLKITMEGLLKKDPDWIVLSYGLYGESEKEARKKLLSEPGASDLTAVKNDRVVLVPGTGSEPSPRALDGLESIVDTIAHAR